MPTIPPFDLPPAATALFIPRSDLGGQQWHISDGSGKLLASVIRHRGSYGAEQGLWEIGALADTGGLDYTTVAVGDDVLGRLTEAQVAETLAALMQERSSKTMGWACGVDYGADYVQDQWERDHAAVTAWMDGQP